MIMVGSKVRCTRTGEIGVVVMITKTEIPPEELARLRAAGGNVDLLANLPEMIMVETNHQTKAGIIRSITDLELLQPS